MLNFAIQSRLNTLILADRKNQILSSSCLLLFGIWLFPFSLVFIREAESDIICVAIGTLYVLTGIFGIFAGKNYQISSLKVYVCLLYLCLIINAIIIGLAIVIIAFLIICKPECRKGKESCKDDYFFYMSTIAMFAFIAWIAMIVFLYLKVVLLKMAQNFRNDLTRVYNY
ncbi:hypothetical protein SteCoe_11636 [Stentor coeruleus]|uniref:Uncharacterized protein n=1 Tax=Stentor coeruleus TaxID=5963 RepID=A0A1R2CCP6_9CILI|nr:hypothetical protein SteCoe_11636 [Stentor coeruleus]